MIGQTRSPSVRTAALEARLQSYAPLKAADIEVVHACGEDARTVQVGAQMLPEVSAWTHPEGHPRLLVAGWAAAARSLPDGRRQILQVYLPGDVLGVSAWRFDMEAVALTATTTTDARPLAAAVAGNSSAHANLRLAWERARAARQQQFLDQIVRLGRLSAYERTAHLMCELIDRHRRAGLSDGRRIPWPLTQEVLSDVLGLSVVHVNRILQQLRRDGLIVLRAGQLATPDANRLAVAASRDPIAA